MKILVSTPTIVHFPCKNAAYLYYFSMLHLEQSLRRAVERHKVIWYFKCIWFTFLEIVSVAVAVP